MSKETSMRRKGIVVVLGLIFSTKAQADSGFFVGGALASDVEVSANADGFSFAAVGTLPVSQRFSLQGRTN